MMCCAGFCCVVARHVSCCVVLFVLWRCAVRACIGLVVCIVGCPVVCVVYVCVVSGVVVVCLLCYVLFA